jgi:hypothetical protein
MAFTQKRLAGALTSSATQLGDSAAQVYAPPSSTTTIIKQIILCNTSGATATASIYILPTGQTTVADAFALFKEVSLDAKETLILNTSIVLTNSAGDKLFMVASATSSITATVFGIEES